MIRHLVLCVAACLLAATPARSEVYELPPEGSDVIGAVSTVTASYEDTLVDIARRHGLGYQDIVKHVHFYCVHVHLEYRRHAVPTDLNKLSLKWCCIIEYFDR